MSDLHDEAGVDHDAAPGDAHEAPPADDLHGGSEPASPGVAADDEEEAERLAPMPSLLETITPTQMAMSVHAHMKELYALTYDREKNTFKADPEKLLNTAAGMLLIALDDRRLSMAMAQAAAENQLFDSFAAAREFSLQGRA